MGISPVQLLIILLIVVLIFGGKRLRNLGGDLGEAIKGFKKATKTEEEKAKDTVQKSVEQGDKEKDVIEGEVKHKDETKG